MSEIADRITPNFENASKQGEHSPTISSAARLNSNLQNGGRTPRYRDSKQDLPTHFTRIMQKAGVEPWAKPFQKLRSTRETELAKVRQIHFVTAWIGNSKPVAAKHYLQATSEDFAKATQYAHAQGLRRRNQNLTTMKKRFGTCVHRTVRLSTHMWPVASKEEKKLCNHRRKPALSEPYGTSSDSREAYLLSQLRGWIENKAKPKPDGRS